MFSPHYLGLDLLSPAHVPVLGIDGQWTVFVLTLHAVCSIVSPIAAVVAVALVVLPAPPRSIP
ncbi:hypothetical protein AB0F91_15945 [Amycolatopsis sp. NPDC023774]|uniref:hypothetical protein n=1 Tax=Amycolatopsis sp. NPDC023774 TaxID=3155015 RepID=UPI0033DDA197